MKVTLLSTTDKKGGAAIAAFRLFKALKASGTEARMLVRDKYSDEGDITSLDKGIIRKTINFLRFAFERICFLPFERSKEIRFFFSLANTGKNVHGLRLVKDSDIIHLHWINQGFLSLHGIKKLIKTGKPLVWTFHDMWAFTGGCHYSGECTGYLNECGNCPFLRNPGPHDLSYRLLKIKERIYKNANITIVGSSEWMASVARQSSILKSFRVESIPIPVDTSLFCPGDKLKTRSSLNLPESKFVILAGAANMKDKRKGYHFLIEALHLLSDRSAEFRDNAVLVTFGKSDETVNPGIPVYANHFLSNEKAIATLYQASDIFILPSLEDNLPNTVIESLACGVPVVAFAVGGIPEMIEHRKTGYLAGIGNVSKLAEGIEWLFSMSDRDSIIHNCREKALLSYSNEACAARYNSLYLSLLKNE